MRFKIYYNEIQEKLDINCLKDSHCDIILPINPEQHVYYPIPENFKDVIKKELLQLIESEQNIIDELKDVMSNVKNLTDKRRELINELRRKMNPQIIEKCQTFREDHAEYFI